MEVIMSKLSYKKLFKMLIDIDMKNTELMEKARISKSTFYKMKNGENITTDVLLRVCDVLKCDVSDIMECVEIDERQDDKYE
jgi:DNA-binding Xre family transcriptional regulator